MNIDWKSEIAKMVYIHQAISKLDVTKLWDHKLPRKSADLCDITKAEEELSITLPIDYKEFLKHANGWPCFYQYVDLFGCMDYLGSKEFRTACDSLKLLPISKLQRDNLLPIAATSDDIDLFCLNLSTHKVIWYAGGEIEQFSSFSEFFLSMMDYNRREYRKLLQESGATS